MHHLMRLAIVAHILWLAACCHAAEGPVHLTTESPFTATLDSIDGDGNITFRAADKLRVVSPRELTWWGRYADGPSGPLLMLQDGSIIRADLLKLDETSLV